MEEGEEKEVVSGGKLWKRGWSSEHHLMLGGTCSPSPGDALGRVQQASHRLWTPPEMVGSRKEARFKANLQMKM